MAEEKTKEFGIELIKFYKEFLLGSSKAVELLASIEHKYPKNYKIIRELKDDPKAIVALSSNMSNEVKTVLFSIFVEASTLATRMNKLFDLSEAEKKTLAKDINTFADRIETQLSGLVDDAETSDES